MIIAPLPLYGLPMEVRAFHSVAVVPPPAPCAALCASPLPPQSHIPLGKTHTYTHTHTPRVSRRGEGMRERERPVKTATRDEEEERQTDTNGTHGFRDFVRGSCFGDFYNCFSSADIPSE